jgi:hypothetical protein
VWLKPLLSVQVVRVVLLRSKVLMVPIRFLALLLQAAAAVVVAVQVLER